MHLLLVVQRYVASRVNESKNTDMILQLAVLGTPEVVETSGAIIAGTLLCMFNVVMHALSPTVHGAPLKANLVSLIVFSLHCKIALE